MKYWARQPDNLPLGPNLNEALLQVVFFAVPGAFTPTCSLKHLPGFIAKADEIKAKGVDTIACVAVNDAFVMDAWGKTVGADDKVLMLADGSAIFTKVSMPSATMLQSHNSNHHPCWLAF